MQAAERSRRRRFCTLRKRIKDCSGTTMVELIVSFFLLSVFLTAVTMVISNALITYYSEKKLMSVYTVADTVLKEARMDIRRMQGSGELEGGVKKKGFVKLRDSDGKTITAKTTETDDAGVAVTAYRGSTIEFVKGNEKDGMLLEQLDAAGCLANTVMIDEENVLKDADTISAAILPGQLTSRYYLIHSQEKKEALKGLFMDRLYADSDVRSVYHELEAGTPVVWDVENRLPKELYQGFTVAIDFALVPYDDHGNEAVSTVVVNVSIYETRDGALQFLHKRSGVVPLENTVYYKKDKTTGFDSSY